MLLLYLFHLDLTRIQIVEKAEDEGHCENTNTHLEWIHEGDEAKDAQSWDGIIGLVVNKVADNAILKLLHILVLRHLEPEVWNKIEI